MMHIIHHQENGAPPDLIGETAKDSILCRFNVPLDQVKAMLSGIRRRRLANYGLSTHTLYVSERGRRLVFKQSPDL